MAARLDMSVDVVASLENRAPRFVERVLAGLSGALPEIAQPAPLPTEDLVAAYRRQIESLLFDAAAEGNVVIVGRLGNAVLGARRDIVRVFLYAPLAWRIAYVQSSLDCDAHMARAEIARIDDARRTYAREQYRMTWGDLGQYDLAVDTARYGIAGAAAVIAAAVRAAHSAA